jgi:uncharacterized protein (TIRG00374 family)
VKRFMLLMLLLGSSLLGVILYRSDLGEVWERLQLLGTGRLALVLSIYVAGTVALTGSWMLTLGPVRENAAWLLRLWRVWLVGNAFEYTTPFGTLGGEPAKAILLKRQYGLRLRDVMSSLVLTRMTDVLAQFFFISTGFALMLKQELLPLPYRVAAASGLALLAIGVVLFFIALHTRVLSRLRTWLERGWLKDRRVSETVRSALDAVCEIDDQLGTFYRAETRRFWLSVVAAFFEWISGAVAAWLVVNALGYPISFAEALVIESFMALVRTALFFVPGDVGTQEGALVLVCGAITGSPATGLALATIRRCRDIVLVIAGLGIASHYSLRDALADEEPEPAAPVIPIPVEGSTPRPAEGRFSRLVR